MIIAGCKLLCNMAELQQRVGKAVVIYNLWTPLTKYRSNPKHSIKEKKKSNFKKCLIDSVAILKTFLVA